MRPGEEAASYSKINRCLGVGPHPPTLSPRPATAAFQTGYKRKAGSGSQAQAQPGEGPVGPSNPCHPSGPGGGGQSWAAAEVRGSRPKALRQSRVRASQPRARPAFGTMRGGWHSGRTGRDEDRQGAGGGMKPLVLDLALQGPEEGRWGHGVGPGPLPDFCFLGRVLEPAPGGQQSVSVLKDSWAW